MQGWYFAGRRTCNPADHGHRHRHRVFCRSSISTRRAVPLHRRVPRAVDLVIPFQKLRRVFAWLATFAVLQQILGVIVFMKMQ